MYISRSLVEIIRVRWSTPLNHHISVKLLLDFDKIWCTTAYVEPDEVLKALSQYLRGDKDK